MYFFCVLVHGFSAAVVWWNRVLECSFDMFLYGIAVVEIPPSKTDISRSQVDEDFCCFYILFLIRKCSRWRGDHNDTHPEGLVSSRIQEWGARSSARWPKWLIILRSRKPYRPQLLRILHHQWMLLKAPGLLPFSPRPTKWSMILLPILSCPGALRTTASSSGTLQNLHRTCCPSILSITISPASSGSLILMYVIFCFLLSDSCTSPSFYSCADAVKLVCTKRIWMNFVPKRPSMYALCSSSCFTVHGSRGFLIF